MRMYDLIMKKRGGEALTKEEIDFDAIYLIKKSLRYSAFVPNLLATYRLIAATLLGEYVVQFVIENR